MKREAQTQRVHVIYSLMLNPSHTHSETVFEADTDTLPLLNGMTIAEKIANSFNCLEAQCFIKLAKCQFKIKPIFSRID